MNEPVIKRGGKRVTIHALWSIYTGKYQVWYEREGVIASASYYLDEVPETPHLKRIPWIK